MCAFVVLDLVSSVRQEIGWEERLQNDLFCVEWDIKPLPVIMIGFMWLTLLLLLQTAQCDYCQKAVPHSVWQTWTTW